MTPERWQEVERVYHAALAHRKEERATFLAEACGADASLVREVESLLARAGAASAFLETPARVAGAAGQAAGQSLVGRRLGPYAIQSVLGVGGMGEVYRAHDTTLGRDVAIKVLPDVWLADPERRARFEREARVLAALNHPNIVTIHSVEQADGVHFLTWSWSRERRWPRRSHRVGCRSIGSSRSPFRWPMPSAPPTSAG